MTDQEKIEALEAKCALLSVSLRKAEEDLAAVHVEAGRIAGNAIALRKDRDAAQRLAEEREQACIAARDFEAGMRAARDEAMDLRSALEAAAQSLLAIRNWAYDDWDTISVRGYANSRAEVAKAVLASSAAPSPDEGVATLLLAERDAKIAALTEALHGVLRVIDCAGGPVQLSFAVQLGQMSWAAKLSDAIAYAQSLLSPPAAKRAFDGDPMAPFESMTAEERADIESERGWARAKTEGK